VHQRLRERQVEHEGADEVEAAPRVRVVVRRLALDELLGDAYPLEQVNEAYAALTGGAVGRAVLVP
jgi:Zn-dependent alcohol dehydrogenase